MAAPAAGPGAPLSLDELLLKGDAEKTEEELEEEDDEELDETLSERPWGLMEMFPEKVLSLFVTQKMYRFSRAALWIGTTSFTILVGSIVFETEKLQMGQQQQLQQRQMLLGPNTELLAGMPEALPSLPGKIIVTSILDPSWSEKFEDLIVFELLIIWIFFLLTLHIDLRSVLSHGNSQLAHVSSTPS
ncbi:mitochondrial import receptor subunit TOM22 homolog [Manis javanica]|uniref:mitochondrial import receptor subunit TOM22 homolog n=1 Tax=Manis javanica TaxID=9974 RepID=UPI00081361C6|nr:mitochondrial import receptor subunit TOM22 homolog [Manis javanica]